MQKKLNTTLERYGTLYYPNKENPVFYMSGRSDLIRQIDEDEYIIIDYKSNKKVFSNKLLKDGMETLAYSLILFAPLIDFFH